MVCWKEEESRAELERTRNAGKASLESDFLSYQASIEMLNGQLDGFVRLVALDWVIHVCTQRPAVAHVLEALPETFIEEGFV